MFEAYKVMVPFQWGNDHMAPGDSVMIRQGEDENGKGIYVGETRCCCGKLTEECPNFVGDVWVVEAGHPRKEAMLAVRSAIYDSSLDADKIIEERSKKAVPV